LTYAHNTKSHTSALPHPSHTVNFTVATAKALSAQSVSRSKDNAHIAKSTASDNRKSETGSEGIVIPANDLPYRRVTKIRRPKGKESFGFMTWLISSVAIRSSMLQKCTCLILFDPCLETLAAPGSLDQGTMRGQCLRLLKGHVYFPGIKSCHNS
jgi:hypothetical protein